MKPSLHLFVLSILCFSPYADAAPPNMLIILADDCTFRDLPIYGGQNAKTPNLDRFAKEGLTFNHAYVSAAMCQPCRAELYTGQFPMRNGCAWNHSASRPGTRSLPDHLHPLGYRTGIAGKVHVQPAESFPFENVPGFDASAVRNPTVSHDFDGIRDFMTRNRDQPFCLVIGLVEPHVPWVMGDASQYPTDKLKLPPYLADTARTREDFSAYLAEITYMDGQVGEILATLEAENLAQDTLVLFTSEQGSQFPGNKWTCWDVGLHTGLVARWPKQVRAGQRTDAMVQYADVVPTLIEIAGGEPIDAETALDGLSFASVLHDQKQTHRKFTYAIHNNFPEGPPYPIRSISDGKWRYIRNLTPNEIYIEKHLMGLAGRGTINNPYWATWVATSWDNPKTYGLVKRYMHRPAEQLYHTELDPYEMDNLANQPAQAAVQAKLSAELNRWLTEQDDPGIEVDTPESHQAAKSGRHRQGPQP